MKVHIYIDKAQTEKIQRMFADYPRTISRIFKESVNKAASKARTDIVAAGNRLTKIRKGIIRRFTSVKKATDKNWTAYVRAWSRGIPVRYLDFDLGPETTKTIETTPKQSVWLYYKYFKKQYGDKAIFSRKYKLKRKVHESMAYKIGRKKIPIPAGSFHTKMPSGYTGVFRRKDNKALKELVGPSIGQILTDNKIEVANIQNNAMAGLSADIDKRIGRYIKMRDTGTLPGRKSA